MVSKVENKISRLFNVSKKILLNRQYRRRIVASLGMYQNLPDKQFLEKKYYANTGKKLNLCNPLGFNEKLQWLKLYDRNPQYTIMSDKYLVKEYVGSIIGYEHIVPTIDAWDKPDMIDFINLPEQFVLKCNHNSGNGMYICKHKRDIDEKKVIKNLKKGFAEDYYCRDREWTYKNISRKVFAEKYMVDSQIMTNLPNNTADGLIDYKFYCFNGNPKFLYVGFANIENGIKHDLLTFLTLDWKIAPFYRKDHEQMPFIPPKPDCLENMIEYARILSQNIPFVRVDFFVINHQAYFSEFTFTPGGGYGLFYPDEWERKIGDWIILPR